MKNRPPACWLESPPGGACNPARSAWLADPARGPRPRFAAAPRLAVPDDLPAIVALQAHALRRLARSVYTTRQIEAFIDMGTMDLELIDSGRYYVVERQATLVACAGWSLDELDDGKTALVRAVYVHPDWARRGLGSLLMNHVHRQAQQAGCQSLRLIATLSGVPLYRQLGYAQTSAAQFPLRGGQSLTVRHMALGIPPSPNEAPNAPNHDINAKRT